MSNVENYLQSPAGKKAIGAAIDAALNPGRRQEADAAARTELLAQRDRIIAAAEDCSPRLRQKSAETLAAMRTAEQRLLSAQGAHADALAEEQNFSHRTRSAVAELENELRAAVPPESARLLEKFVDEMETLWQRSRNAVVVERRDTGKFDVWQSKHVEEFWSNSKSLARRLDAIRAAQRAARRGDDRGELWLLADASPESIRAELDKLRAGIPDAPVERIESAPKTETKQNAPTSVYDQRGVMNVAAPGHPVGEAQ